MQKVKFDKKILIFLLIGLLLCASIGITFSYLYDKKKSSVDFKVASLNDTYIVSTTIDSSDLVCGKTFTKNVTLTNKANFDYYIRVWAECSTQVYEKQTNTYIEATNKNLVSVTGVTVGGTSLSKNTTNNKYVYSTAVGTTTSSLTFQFAFKVGDSFTEELNYHFDENGKWVLNNDLQTTIIFKAEIIQKEAGLESWS